MGRGGENGELTVYALANFDDLSQSHRFLVLGSEMGQDTGTKRDLLVQVALGEAIAAQLELRRVDRVEIGVQDAERVQIGNVVTAHLICANEQLNLRETRCVNMVRSLIGS